MGDHMHMLLMYRSRYAYTYRRENVCVIVVLMYVLYDIYIIEMGNT